MKLVIDMNIELSKIRISLGLTQKELSNYLNIPLRTLENWETGKRTPSEWTYDLIMDKIMEYEKYMTQKFDKENGVYTFSILKHKILKTTKEYNINRIVLFGSYAKGKANARSDVDILIDTPIKGLAFVGILEDLTNALNKDIDLIHLNTIDINSNFFKEIKKSGITIYERQ